MRKIEGSSLQGFYAAQSDVVELRQPESVWIILQLRKYVL
jgi:hypothetical protein